MSARSKTVTKKAALPAKISIAPTVKEVPVAYDTAMQEHHEVSNQYILICMLMKYI